MIKAGSVIAALGLSALAGGMLFFGAVMAPLVFIKLPPEVAGPFIRAAFPFYYGYVVAASGLGAVGFGLRGRAGSAGALLAVGLVTVWLWVWWLPHLEGMRLAGDAAGFAWGHRLSVWVNGAQLMTALWLLVRTAI